MQKANLLKHKCTGTVYENNTTNELDVFPSKKIKLGFNFMFS